MQMTSCWSSDTAPSLASQGIRALRLVTTCALIA
jgi:hypothetical protein